MMILKGCSLLELIFHEIRILFPKFCYGVEFQRPLEPEKRDIEAVDVLGRLMPSHGYGWNEIGIEIIADQSQGRELADKHSYSFTRKIGHHLRRIRGVSGSSLLMLALRGMIRPAGRHSPCLQ